MLLLVAVLGLTALAIGADGGWEVAAWFLVATVASGVVGTAAGRAWRRARGGGAPDPVMLERLQRELRPALPPPPLDDPTALLQPFGPGERVVWSGGPRRRITRAFLREQRATVLLGVLGLAVHGGWLLLLRGTGGMGQLSSSALLYLVTALLALGPLASLALLTLSWSVRLGRIYVLTNERGLVVDAARAHLFAVDLEAARVEGDGLRFGVGDVRVVAQGRYPWGLPAIAARGHRAPVFADLEAPAAVLETLRSAARDT